MGTWLTCSEAVACAENALSSNLIKITTNKMNCMVEPFCHETIKMSCMYKTDYWLIFCLPPKSGLWRFHAVCCDWHTLNKDGSDHWSHQTTAWASMANIALHVFYSSRQFSATVLPS